jgi:hypothetical protein
MRKLFQVAAAQHRAVLMDLPTVALWKKAGVVKDDQVHPCGVLFSLGRQPDPPPFPASGTWWDQPFLMHDLCAAAVLRDYQVAAQQVAAYWHAHGDAARAAQTGAVAERIRKIADAYRADKPFLGWRDR